MRIWPRHYDAIRSRCYYTNNFHAYFFKDQPCSRGLQTGVSFKHRRRDRNWRHVSFRVMRYASGERNFGWVRHFEVTWHLSRKMKTDRVIGSKRYLRFKICV